MTNYGDLELSIEAKPEDIGLLPYETRFIKQSLGSLALQKIADTDAFAEAANNSGGDWALDDPATAAAAEAAHLTDLQIVKLRKLVENGQIDYPEESAVDVTFGSRITVEMNGFTDTYDIPTHLIPGLVAEEGVDFLSPFGPLGQAVLGKKLGDEITWTLSDGRVLRAKLVGVDQTSQKDFFDNRIPE